MKRIWFVSAGVIMLALVVGAAEDKSPTTVKDVMANHKKNMLRDQIGADLKKDSPDWAAIQKKTKQYAAQVAGLQKLDPPKGDKESWNKLAGDFVAKVKQLDEAAENKDMQAALAVHQSLGTACMGCHKQHRP